jgi:hypothetical protein
MLKTKYIAIGDTSRDLQLADGKGIMSHVSEYTYLVVRITKDGYHEPEINDRINRGQAAIKKLNSNLWNRDVTPKTKTHIYHSIVKSTLTYVAETWCLKAKTKFHRHGFPHKIPQYVSLFPCVLHVPTISYFLM